MFSVDEVMAERARRQSRRFGDGAGDAEPVCAPCSTRVTSGGGVDRRGQCGRGRGCLSGGGQAATMIACNPGLGRLRPDLAASRYRFWSLRGFPYRLIYDAERRTVADRSVRPPIEGLAKRSGRLTALPADSRRGRSFRLNIVLVRLRPAPHREGGDQRQHNDIDATPQGAPAHQPPTGAAISGAGPPAMIEPSSRAKAKPE